MRRTTTRHHEQRYPRALLARQRVANSRPSSTAPDKVRAIAVVQ